MDELRNCMRHMDLKGSLVRPTANPMLQFIRYVFVGGIATAIDWSTLYVLEHCRVHYLIAAAAAFSLFRSTPPGGNAVGCARKVR